MNALRKHEAVRWMLDGGRTTDRPGGDLWTVIDAALVRRSAKVALRCGSLLLSRAALLDAIRLVPLEHRNRRVGVCMGRSALSVAATLAIWRSGGVYVPLGLELPEAARNAMVDSCALDHIVADRPLSVPGYQLVAARTVAGALLLLYDADRPAQRLPEPGLCAILHTSGTTGRPKGVRITHAAVLNRIATMRALLGVGEDDRFLYKCPVVFDVHLWEFLLPVISGAVVSIHPQEQRLDLFAIARLIVEDGVTIAGFTPSLLHLLLRMPILAGANSLRAVLCGGEAWSPRLARAFFRVLPGRALYNSYGPTETTIAVANWRVPDDPGLSRIALGAPLANTVFRIDEQEREVSGGSLVVSGELSIGGVQVADGYVGDGSPDRFEPGIVHGAPMRFYRTGDIVRLDTASGTLMFAGRDDNQVKLNGVRLELEAVETAIAAIDGIDRCVAFLDNQPKPRLRVAYTTRDRAAIPWSLLQRASRTGLPGMISPVGYHRLDELPLRPSGKIDRAALVARCLTAEASP